MHIGIIGLGLVGSAIKYGFKKLGHKVDFHDIKQNTSINDIINSEVCFICVPTPSLDSGKCNVKIVKSVVNELSDINYGGLIAIKSTVEPGTTARLMKLYPKLKISYVPEFLRERCAEIDFISNHDVCIIGTDNKDYFSLVKNAHGNYPRKFVQLSVTEAELSKYFNNVYNATLITFANNFYEICKTLGVDYTKVKNGIVERAHITNLYLDCNDNFRGFGGPCLPKDTKALQYLADKINSKGSLFKTVLEDNKKYKTTVHENMREE